VKLLGHVINATFFVLFSIAPLAQTTSNETSQTTSISLLDVFKSTLQHHPQILAAQAQLEQAAAKQLASQGAFDWKIDHSSQTRTGGFYDGWFTDQSIGRQLPWANAKISSGYRRSEGSLPIYENQYETLSDGEVNLKLSLALLKDRAIDSERNTVRQADIDYGIAEIDFSLGMNALLLEAAYSYLAWYQACQEVEIVRDLRALATSRREAITAQVNNGDMANIVLTEFDTTLLNRTLAVLERQQAGAVAGKNLSMFLRDKEGKPLTLDLHNCNYRQNHLDFSGNDADLNQLNLHPALVRIDSEIAQISNLRQLAKNELLPELDVEFLLADDTGRGSETLEGLESYVGLRFSVPIERRKAKGKFAEADAKLTELEQKRQQLLDKLRIDIEATQIRIHNVKQQYQAQKRRAQLATRLAEQELLRFNAGDSDLFLLNTRERNIGVAKLSVIKLQTDLTRLNLSLLAKLARLDLSVKKAVTGTD
jgi:outer membrane protein TolC